MDTAAIITLIATVVKEAVDIGPSVIATVEDATPYAKLVWDHLVNKKVITEADLANLEAGLAATSAKIQADLPAQQDDDV